MATCIGALLVTIQEAGHGATIYPTNVKRLAACGHVMCRFPDRNRVPARWSAAILMTSNKATMYERDVSNAMERRDRLLRFSFRFVDNPDPRKKEQKKADLSLDEKFTTHEYGAQFLMMGLENLQRLQEARNYETKRKLYEVPHSV
jgi:phage/plasmid-associated DNA primase